MEGRTYYENTGENMENKSVLIMGYYGTHNLGDDYILYSIIRQIPESYKIKIISEDDEYRDLKDLFKNLEIIKKNKNGVLFTAKTIAILSKSTRFIIGGGGLFPRESNKNLLKTYLLVKWAKKYGCKVAIHGVEVNSINKTINKLIWKKILNNIDYFYTRNNRTFQMLSDFSENSNIYYGSDVTFSLQDHCILNREISGNNIVLIAPAMPWSDLELKDRNVYLRYCKLCRQFANLVISLIENGNTCRFIPFYYKRDNIFIDDILKLIDLSYKSECKVLDIRNIDIANRNRIFSDVNFVVAMRYHSVLFSIFYEKPFLAISYSPKTTALMLENNLSNYIEFGIRSKDFFYTTFDLDEDELIMLVNRLIENKNNLIISVREANKKLKERTKKGIKLLGEFLK